MTTDMQRYLAASIHLFRLGDPQERDFPAVLAGLPDLVHLPGRKRPQV